MRNTVIAVGLTLCVFAIFGRSHTSALQIDELAVVSANSQEKSSDVITTGIAKVFSDEGKRNEAAPTIVLVAKHTVVKGETLSDIAKQYDTTWRRIYDKNKSLADPDTIETVLVLVIPQSTEKLDNRPLPTASIATSGSAASSAVAATQIVSTAQPVGSSAGNGYFAGYCTWYAKSRRPDMPNNLGNADTWVARAAAQGFATGSVPRAGAIGQQGMHVVYVERVNSDGSVTISEMNYQGFGVVSSRTVPASTFMYIY